MKFRKIVIAGAGIFLALLGAGYWYVFVAGAPQFDPPKEVADPEIPFRLESFTSQAMGAERTYGVILPPEYEKHLQQRYPVIFLLHGGHDDARAYVDKYAIISVLKQLYQTKKLPPSIVITPDGNDNRGSSPLWDPQYYDGPNGKVGTLIGSELVQIVKSRYRTWDNPHLWALGGLSSGGWGALNIGLRHLNNFNIFLSHSGYFVDNSGPANSPNVFIKQIPAAQRQKLRVYLDAGKADADLLASTQQFHATLNQLGVQNVFYAFPGGHGLSGEDYGWNYFHKHLKDSLSYVGKQFQEALARQQ
jgi:enterochelin esterase-like enzyme